MSKSVLVVDDEKLIRWSLSKKLTSWGYVVEAAEDAESAYQALHARLPDLVLLDIKLPDGNGVDILAKINTVSPDVVVIMITAEATVETAIRAMKLGAYDYIAKPFNFDELQVLIEKALEKAALKKSLDYYQADQRAELARDRLIGNSPQFSATMDLVKKVSRSPLDTVLLLGESGTGKNLVAKAIHQYSTRVEQPFVTIECTTIPENLLESELFGHERGAFTDARAVKKGLFELADSGTIFIDEIGDLPPIMQGKLLRVIDEKRFKRVGGITDYDVDIRIIAATNKDLAKSVEERLFRRDLFFRLNVVPITLPPLRQRGDDAVLLAEFFMKEFSRRFGKKFKTISPQARAELCRYSWPGNVRELRNAIERVVLLEAGEQIEKEHLVLKSAIEVIVERDDEPVPSLAGQLTMDEVEAEMIRRALVAAAGNQTQAAKTLGVSRDVLRYRIKKYHVDPSAG